MTAKRKSYPSNPETIRPYRIWNAQKKRAELYRYFAYHDNAIEAAWRDLQWTKIGTSLEVFDTTNGRHLATMTRSRQNEFERQVHRDFNFKRPTEKAKEA